MRLSVVKQSFFDPPGQYGRRVTRVNGLLTIDSEATLFDQPCFFSFTFRFTADRLLTQSLFGLDE